MRCDSSQARFFVSMALVCWLTYQGVTAAEPSAELGLVKEKPAAGRFVETDRGFMVEYAMTIPGSEVAFEMVPIPAGAFRMGSPESEEGRTEDEGPTFEVTVEPFWMAKCEVTWAEYREYMSYVDLFKDLVGKGLQPLIGPLDVDAVTSPSRLYDPSFTFDKGNDPRLPAVSMSQFAARQYTEWLSRLCGVFHRLPSEAEWEYACRAGTSTAWSFGDDPAGLDEHAWTFDNSDDTPHQVGTRKPNPWGLHDMHGNVSEWVLDQMLEDGFTAMNGEAKLAAQAVVWPKKLYPRVLKGGSWDSDPEESRSASRMGSSDQEWTETDPNLPKSPWWFTDGPALGIGFRVIRPLNSPPAAEYARYWDADVEAVRIAVEQRLNEGRGTAARVDPSMVETFRSLKQPGGSP